MKSVFIILGNGFTIDFINKYNDFLENKKDLNAWQYFGNRKSASYNK